MRKIFLDIQPGEVFSCDVGLFLKTKWRCINVITWDERDIDDYKDCTVVGEFQYKGFKYAIR